MIITDFYKMRVIISVKHFAFICLS